MEHSQHAHRDRQAHQSSLNRTAWSATLHCLSGCAIGEILGMVIGTALGWDNVATIALAVALAFVFGFALTLLPLVKATGFGLALKLALASDTASITVMEIVDNAIMLVIPGAMDAGLGTALFWGSLAFSLVIAAVAAFPINRWLIARGKGHAVVHAYHHHHDSGKGGTMFKLIIAAAATVALTATAFVALTMEHHGKRNGAVRPASSEFGFGPRPSAGQLYAATLQLRQPLRVRQLQTLTVRITDASGRPMEGARISVDGGMPEHGHGLPTAPKVRRALGGGVYEIEGLRFNMNGWWELKLAIESPAGADSVTFNLSL